MKSKLAIVAFLSVMAFVTYSAFAAGQSFVYLLDRENWNMGASQPFMSGLGYHNAGGGRNSKAGPTTPNEESFYLDWSAAQKADILDKMTNIALPADHFWLLQNWLATGDSIDARRFVDPYIPLEPRVGVFFSDVDWNPLEACNDEATLGVPWVNSVTHANTQFWGLSEMDNSAYIVGGWWTASQLGIIQWNTAVLDKPLVTALLTDANAKGLRYWQPTNPVYWLSNDYNMGVLKWGNPGPGTARLMLREALGGDANLDETCDFTDYQALERNFGRTSRNWVDGDFNQDGTVDFSDYMIMERQFGRSIPEPATLALVALGLGGLVSLRKRRVLLVVLGVALIGGLAASSQAATVTLTITSPSAGTWYAYAQVAGGSKGLSSFEINVTADSGLVIATSTNKSPRYLDSELEALVGFSYQRGNGSPAGMRITGGQVTAYSGGNDPLQDALVLQNVGILAGSHGSTSWAVPVLLASGTYTGSAGWLHLRPYVGASSLNLLSSVGGGGWVGPGNVEGAGAVVGPLTWDYYVPEPATLALIAGGLAALTLRRRR